MSIKVIHFDGCSIHWRLSNTFGDSKIRAVLVGDSRLWNLQKLSWPDFPLKFLDVVATRGAKIQDMHTQIFNVLSAVEGDSFVTLKICLGINNILFGDDPSLIADRLYKLESKYPQEISFNDGIFWGHCSREFG